MERDSGEPPAVRDTGIPNARIRIEFCGRSAVAVTDREGYFDVLLERLQQLPGRHDCTVTPIDPPGPAVTGRVHVPDPAADLVVVTNIDDTIVDSGVAHGIASTVRTVLLRDAATRVPLDGAVELARGLARGGDDAHERLFVYLSTNPWNFVEFLLGFLDRHGFPAGPLVLTDWGPSEHGPFRISSSRHKLSTLQVLAQAMPYARFLLIGDSGQNDPEIYERFAVQHPDRVAAIFIRQASRPGRRSDARLASWSARLDERRVPVLIATDGDQMLTEAVRLRLAQRRW